MRIHELTQLPDNQMMLFPVNSELAVNCFLEASFVISIYANFWVCDNASNRGSTHYILHNKISLKLHTKCKTLEKKSHDKILTEN